jgi:hypothetical protein
MRFLPEDSESLARHILNNGAEYVKSRVQGAEYVSVRLEKGLRASDPPILRLDISLDDKSEWINNIFENSNLFKVILNSYDGSLEVFCRGYQNSVKFRKLRVKTLQDAVNEINAYIAQIIPELKMSKRIATKCAYIDWQSVGRSLQTGDRVRVFNSVDGRFSPWEGHITAVMAHLGMVDVQTPFGNVRLPVEDVTVVSRDPVLEDTGYKGYDNTRNKDDLTLQYTPEKVKTALYWKAKGRKYMPTRSEEESGNYVCPKCDSPLKNSIYKKRTKLFVCTNNECNFCIRPVDIIHAETCDGEDKPLLDDTNPRSQVLRIVKAYLSTGGYVS